MFNPKESVEMPFRTQRQTSYGTLLTAYPGYIANGTEPILPPGMREHLHSDLNQSFDF